MTKTFSAQEMRAETKLMQWRDQDAMLLQAADTLDRLAAFETWLKDQQADDAAAFDAYRKAFAEWTRLGLGVEK